MRIRMKRRITTLFSTHTHPIKTLFTLSIMRNNPVRGLLLCGLVVLTSQTATAGEHSLQTDISEETIRIGDTVYAIPEPWIGNSISAPALSGDAFSRIPVEHTRDGSNLYVLKAAHSALLRLLAAAKDDGIILEVESGYRSPAYQKKIFSRMLSEGRYFDDIIRYVAPPGYSQHALGTAVDFYPSNWRFSDLPDYVWLREHAAEYGFTETYPQHNSLSYPWEAWHWSYTREQDKNNSPIEDES